MVTLTFQEFQNDHMIILFYLFLHLPLHYVYSLFVSKISSPN